MVTPLVNDISQIHERPKMNGRIVLAGGSGFLGRSLAAFLLTKGYETITLTRSTTPCFGYAHWDGINAGDWTQHVDGATAIINLTGRSVDCRYTPANRREIIQSRVNSVRALGDAVRKCHSPPSTWIQAASLAIYGDSGDMICNEDAPHGSGFSVDVCQRWEDELGNQELPNTRTTVLRIGFALDANGGALGRLAMLTRLFLGGTVGNGRQYISWLHIDDLNKMFDWCLENKKACGIYNATGATPVTNAAFMAALRRALRRPWSPPVPPIAVRVGAYLMGTDASLALTGRRCMPKRLLDEGFKFIYTGLDDCLSDVFTDK